MKSKTHIVGALLLICGIAGGLLYASMDESGSAAVVSHGQPHEQQGTQGAAAHSQGSDHFGCHNHGAAMYHCH